MAKTNESGNRQQMLQMMTTEHFVLQTARATTVQEANQRANLYLTTVSSATIALAFVAQVTQMGRPFVLFSLILLPCLYFIGLVTFVRAVQVAIEDMVHARGMARIRHFYAELAPDTKRYLIHATHDDHQALLTDKALDYFPYQSFMSTAGLVSVVDGAIAGVFAECWRRHWQALPLCLPWPLASSSLPPASSSSGAITSGPGTPPRGGWSCSFPLIAARRQRRDQSPANDRSWPSTLTSLAIAVAEVAYCTVGRRKLIQSVSGDDRMPENRHTVIAEEPGSLAMSRRPSALRSFFTSRWRGEAALATVFWRDMVLVGSVINVVMGVAAIVLFAAKAPTAIALLAFLAPVPYNLFLFLSVWRSADRSGGMGFLAKLGATAWLVAATVI